MMLRPNYLAIALAGCALLASAPLALAHVSADGPAFAGENQVIAFHVGHGCSGADTYSLEIHLPEEVISVRAMPSAFGSAQVVTDDAQLPTSVIWTKSGEDLKATDDQYYELKIRIAVPDQPFSTLEFPTTQICRAEDGTETTVEWDGSADEPSPSVVVMPARAAGWNKYTVSGSIDDLEAYFGDAQIVWAGNAAYSANPTTMALIEAEANVEPLATIEAGTEIWVKY